MKYFEFGQQNEKLMVLLHGGGICYRGALPVAEALSKDFHVVLVAYDGFNPTEPETEFVSVMDEARRVGDYVVEHYGGKIDILYLFRSFTNTVILSWETIMYRRNELLFLMKRKELGLTA